jgi:hypothetical protein
MPFSPGAHRHILHDVYGGDTDVQYRRIYVRALRQTITTRCLNATDRPPAA